MSTEDPGRDVDRTDEYDPRNLFKPKTLWLGRAFFPFYWMWRYLTQRWTHDPAAQAELVYEGLLFGEALRYRDGFLYLSDMHANRVVKIDISNPANVTRTDFDDKVSGLGWLPDGQMLVVGMDKLQVLRHDEKSGVTQLHADISKVARYKANDMVVAMDGTAYVGNFGFDIDKLLTTSATTTLASVSSTGRVKLAATDVWFPNGSVITPDGKTLIVAETLRGYLTAFDRLPDGSLANPRTFADVGLPLDGMCLDAEGMVWVCAPFLGVYDTCGCIMRVAEGGKVLEVYGFGFNGFTNQPITPLLVDHPDGSHYLYFVESITGMEKVIASKYGSKNSWLKRMRVGVGPAKSADSPRYNAGFC